MRLLVSCEREPLTTLRTRNAVMMPGFVEVTLGGPPNGCRHHSRNSASGFSISRLPAIRPLTWSSPTDCRVHWTSWRCGMRSPRWCPGTKPCEPGVSQPRRAASGHRSRVRSGSRGAGCAARGRSSRGGLLSGGGQPSPPDELPAVRLIESRRRRA